MTHPNEPEIDFDVDVPAPNVENLEKFTPESLYPVSMRFEVPCLNCGNWHETIYIRKGFRLHDDGPTAIYELESVT